MKKLLYIILSLALFISCEDEFDINNNGTPLAVVNGIYYLEPRSIVDSFASYTQVIPNYIKLTKSFSGKDNPLEISKIHDSIYFKEAVVKIEYYYEGNNVGENYLEKTIEYQKRTGLFSNEQNIIYKTTEHEVPRFFDTVRLTIDPIGSNSPISASSPYVSTPNAIVSQNEIFSEKIIGFFIRGEPFIIGWDDNCGYYESTLIIKYSELISGEKVQKEILWNKGRVSQNNKDYIFFDWKEMLYLWGVETNQNNIPSHNQIIYSPESFYNFLRTNIRDNPNVTKRKLESIDIIVTATTRDFYEYLNFGKSTQDNGKIFTNINNGIGIFTAACINKHEGLNLDKQSEDSLIFGHLTKHLKFVNYDIGN